ncbi:MAG: replication-relaxation family protein [Bdellovibrio sp.]|nr:replication-relaxation family protein [Bdellovibrio sp.]
MTITQRDRKLFSHLSNYGMLTTKHVNEIIFGGIAITTVLRRLRILEEEKYLKRLVGLESQDILWTMTDKAALLGEGEQFKRYWNKNLLEHDFKLLNLRLALEKQGIAKSWIPEHKIRYLVFKKHGIEAAQKMLVPDGLMVTEVQTHKVSVAVELELSLKNKDRLEKNFSRYLEKKDLAYIWYICQGPLILNCVHKAWNAVKGYKSTIKLHSSLLTEVMQNPKAPWIEAAHSPAHGVSTKTIEIKSAPPWSSGEYPKTFPTSNAPP